MRTATLDSISSLLEVLIVGSVVDANLHAVTQGKYGKIYSGGGLALILESFCAVHNLSYRIRKPPDGEYGSDPDGDGRFSGVVGLVQDNLVDLGAGLFSMTADRTRVVKFSTTFGVEENTILMNTPNLHKPKNIFDPFDKTGKKRLLQKRTKKDDSDEYRGI